ncbi:MAG: zinc ribbon domain-containing protein, partial [Pirellulaceae bacterium]
TEEYSISPEQAIALAEKEFRKRQKNAISGFMPGDTYQNLQIETNMTLNDSDLILLPVYVLSYRYKDKVYRFLINGQTGKVFGEKPWSKKRIGVGIGALVVLIAAVAFGISQLLH